MNHIVINQKADILWIKIYSRVWIVILIFIRVRLDKIESKGKWQKDIKQRKAFDDYVPKWVENHKLS